MRGGNALRLICALAGASFLSGCSIPIESGNGTIHYVIIGAGVVSVSNPETNSAAFVSKVQALGLSATEQPGLNFNFGYTEGSFVAVPNGVSDVRIEVSQDIMGPLRVYADKMQMIEGEEDDN